MASPSPRTVAEYAVTLRRNLADLRAGQVSLGESDAIATRIRAEIVDRHLVCEVVAYLMGREIPEQVETFPLELAKKPTVPSLRRGTSVHRPRRRSPPSQTLH